MGSRPRTSDSGVFAVWVIPPEVVATGVPLPTRVAMRWPPEGRGPRRLGNRGGRGRVRAWELVPGGGGEGREGKTPSIKEPVCLKAPNARALQVSSFFALQALNEY